MEESSDVNTFYSLSLNNKIQKKRIVKPNPVNTEINCNISVMSVLIFY